MKRSNFETDLNQNRTIIRIQPYYLLVGLAFCSDSVLRFIEQIIIRIPIISYVSFAFEPALFLTLIIICCKRLTNNIRFADIGFLYLFYILLLLSAFFYDENVEYILENLSDIVFVFVPLFFLGLSIDTIDDEQLTTFQVLAYISIVIAWLYNIYYYSTGRSLGTDEMGLSYIIVPHVMISIWLMFKQMSWYSIAFSVLGVLYVLALGTRGPLLIVLVFSAFLFLHKAENNRKLKVLVFIVSFAIAIILLSDDLFNSILWKVRDILVSLGYSTRITDAILMKDTYLEPSESIGARQLIYEKLRNLLSEHPYIGYGLYGEYPYISWSAHNMYLQTCFEFGYPLGVILIICFFFKAIKTIIGLHRIGDENTYLYTLLWLIFIIAQSTFGGNIISYYMFFTLGLLANQNRRIYNFKQSYI